jgi:hypothetical protein
VTKNKTINKTLQQFSQKFIDKFYKEAQKQESAYKKYVANTHLESATFITKVLFLLDNIQIVLINRVTNIGAIIFKFNLLSLC